MAKKKQRRTIVASPLTPTLLKELGAIDEFPATPKNFDPYGNWVNTYRIWTCHGFRESGNQDVGFVRIERAAGSSNEKFTLKVRQEVVQVDGIVNVINANIQCLNKQLATPVQWHLSSRFIDPDKRPLTRLETDEKALIKGNVISVEIGEHTFKRKVTGHLTSDWCVFEFIQRLKFEEQGWLAFDMLEGLTVMKQNQRLSYRGLHPTKIGAEQISLHCFVQTGSGILPYEYWLDSNHRLVAAISMHKAYILDERAEKILIQRTEQLRNSYRRIKSGGRK